MALVQIPKEFFVKERRMYSNWPVAFWRELFQNSVDAGANVIDVEVVQKEDGVIGVSFVDNGCGMTREVLDKVYFDIGKTTKTGGDQVGGFGRARLLTCFSMKSYTIHTLNNLVQGDGPFYEIAEVDYRYGCSLNIEIENENFESIKDALYQYLHMSQMDCVVNVNGVRFRDWCYRRQASRDLLFDGESFGTVYVNKSGTKNLLIIRVQGAMMYSQYVGANAQIIIEIDSSKSREVLTANRDSMHSRFSSVLNGFIEELSVDTKSSLRNRYGKKSATIRGSGLIFSFAKKKIDTKLSEEEVNTVSLSNLSLNNSYQFDNKTIGIDFGADLGDNRKVLNNVDPGNNYLRDLPDIFIVDDTENDKVRKVIDLYNPKNWVVINNRGQTYNKGSNLYKLLMLWKIACDHSVNALLDVYPSLNGVQWGLGWYFSDNAEACCHNPQHNGYAFLLNPVDSSGKLKYSIRNRKDMKKLIALAKHEVAHVVEKYHNEDFASILTSIDMNVDEKDIFVGMKSEISEA